MRRKSCALGVNCAISWWTGRVFFSWSNDDISRSRNSLRGEEKQEEQTQKSVQSQQNQLHYTDMDGVKVWKEEDEWKEFRVKKRNFSAGVISLGGRSQKKREVPLLRNMCAIYFFPTREIPREIPFISLQAKWDEFNLQLNGKNIWPGYVLHVTSSCPTVLQVQLDGN